MKTTVKTIGEIFLGIAGIIVAALIIVAIANTIISLI